MRERDHDFEPRDDFRRRDGREERRRDDLHRRLHEGQSGRWRGARRLEEGDGRDEDERPYGLRRATQGEDDDERRPRRSREDLDDDSRFGERAPRESRGGSYDQAAGSGRRRPTFGAEEQEQAWIAGGAWEHFRGPYAGPHAGKGPKGYRRSDERILDDACETLERHPAIDASEITVSCEGGEILLRGTVESRETKRLAEQAVEDIPGVRDVRNELRVQPLRAGEGEQPTSQRTGS